MAEGQHLWSDQRSVREIHDERDFGEAADNQNFANLKADAKLTSIDFVACSPLEAGPQLETLAKLGVDPSSTTLTIPLLGHTGPADFLLSLGITSEIAKPHGPNVVMTTRTTLASKAIAIRGSGSSLQIATRGRGLDPHLWTEPHTAQSPTQSTIGAELSDLVRALFVDFDGEHLTEQGAVDSALAIEIGLAVEAHFDVADTSGLRIEDLQTLKTLEDRVVALQIER